MGSPHRPSTATSSPPTTAPAGRPRTSSSPPRPTPPRDVRGRSSTRSSATTTSRRRRRTGRTAIPTTAGQLTTADGASWTTAYKLKTAPPDTAPRRSGTFVDTFLRDNDKPTPQAHWTHGDSDNGWAAHHRRRRQLDDRVQAQDRTARHRPATFGDVRRHVPPRQRQADAAGALDARRFRQRLAEHRKKNPGYVRVDVDGAARKATITVRDLEGMVRTANCGHALSYTTP